jgi:hypothetical protein
MAVVAAYDTKQGKRYRVRYRTPDNRQTDKRGFRPKRDAELFLNTVEVAKLKGEYVNPADARRTVDDLGTAWLARQKSHLKPSGYAVMETTWRVRVQPRWGHVALGDIKPTAIQSWMAELVSQPTNARPSVRQPQSVPTMCFRALWLMLYATI